MARNKSLIVGVKTEKAERAHNCKNNARHRIKRGDTRLKVRNGRNWSNYCLQCANSMIERGHETLNTLAQDLQHTSNGADH